jgi:zinc protease
MRNHLGTAIALALAAASLAGPPAAAAAPATAAAPELKPDPAVRFGSLPNGMRYQILRNTTPPHNASLRLRIDVGSLYETEDQRGLAHFLEHMVLNGTKNVPEGEFVRRLERAGLKFGPDTNASTDFEQTVYMLDLPRTDAETVDTALFLLREVAGEATFLPAAIDSERGIVLSEERTRATPQLRNAEDELGYLLKGDILPSRLPIGLTEVLKTAPQARFRAFYDAYYRPERATLIAVGDFDVDAMEKKIRDQFGNWAGRGAAGPEVPASRIAARGAESRIFVDPGIPSRVSLSWISPPDLRPDSRAVRTEALIAGLGLRVLNRRFQRLGAEADAPFAFAGSGTGEQADRAEITQVIAILKPGKWKEALAALDAEQRRAAQYGVTQAELDREIEEIRTALANAANGAGTRPSNAIAQEMLAAVNAETVFQAPAESLAEFELAVKALKAETVSASIAKLFAGKPLVYLTGPTPIEGGEQALLAAYEASARTPVAAAAVQQAAAWPYTTFGKPGGIAERKEIAALGVSTILFSNGVRLTVKPTDFRKDEILVSTRFGHGTMDVAPAETLPAFMLAFGAYGMGGLGKISLEDMQQALSAKVFGAGFSIADDAFVLSGRTRPADVATQLQVLAAYATDPGLRQGAWDRLRSISDAVHDQLASTPGGVFSRESGLLLHDGDARWAFPTREEIAKADLARARDLVSGLLRRGPIELVMVGDITVDEAVKQVAATFGALPPRADQPVPETAARAAFPAPGLVRATHKGRADQGLAFIAWPTADFYADQKRTRTLNLLGQVLQLRLTDEIREKQGTTYSPNASHSPSETFAGYGYMAAQIEAPPERLDGFLKDAAAIAASLRETPIDADELQRARKPLVESIERQKAGNQWWLSELANIQTHSGVAASIAQGIAQYEAITPVDLRQAARDYLVDAKAWKLEIVPETAK